MASDGRFEEICEVPEDLARRDQFFIACERQLETFLDEIWKVTIKELSQAACSSKLLARHVQSATV